MKSMFQPRVTFFEKLLYLMPGFVYWKDEHGKYIGCNQHEQALLGGQSGIVIGQVNSQLIGPCLAEVVDEVDSKIIVNGVPSIIEEVGFNLKRQEAIYFTKKSPVFNESTGDNVGLFGVSLDITSESSRLPALRIEKEKITYAVDYFKRLLLAIADDVNQEPVYHIKFLVAAILNVLTSLLQAYDLGLENGANILNIVKQSHQLMSKRLLDDCSPLVQQIYLARSQRLLQ